MRRLEVSVSGRWYVLLTTLLGVVALVSGNNVLYLSESLLLSGLILSGVLSERAISGIEIRVRRGSAVAGQPAHDTLEIRNRRRSPAFCLEIGEWRGKEYFPAAFVPRVGGRASVVVASTLTLPRRGLHRWDGWYVATSYPFGFARKRLLEREGGERRVWPAHAEVEELREGDSRSRSRPLQGTELNEGEIRPYLPEDDWRLIVWTLSSRGGDPVVRNRRAEGRPPEVTLDLAAESEGEPFERRVRAAARPFHEHSDAASSPPVLLLLEPGGKRKLRGRRRALDELSIVKPLAARRGRA